MAHIFLTKLLSHRPPTPRIGRRLPPRIDGCSLIRFSVPRAALGPSVLGDTSWRSVDTRARKTSRLDGTNTPLLIGPATGLEILQDSCPAPNQTSVNCSSSVTRRLRP